MYTYKQTWFFFLSGKFLNTELKFCALENPFNMYDPFILGDKRTYIISHSAFDTQRENPEGYGYLHV